MLHIMMCTYVRMSLNMYVPKGVANRQNSKPLFVATD